MKTLYDILGVSNTASEAEIKRAFYKLSRCYHPDRGGNEAISAEINAAYDVLGKPDLRLKYDIQLMLDGLFGDFKQLVKRVYENKEWIKFGLFVSMGSLIGSLITRPFSSSLSSTLLWTSLTINSYLGYRLVSEIMDLRKQSSNRSSFFQPVHRLQLTDYPHQSIPSLENSSGASDAKNLKIM